MNILVLLPVNDRHRAILESSAPGEDFIYTSSDAATREQVADADVILGNNGPDMLTACEHLQLLQLQTAGYDDYLAAGTVPAEAKLSCSIGAYGQAVSEHMFAMVLSMMKRLPGYHDLQREHRWEDLGPVTSLKNANVLVLGAGDIGGHFATLCRNMGAHVRGIKRHPLVYPIVFEDMDGMDALPERLAEADIVASFMPSTPETRGLANAEFFAAMKPGQRRPRRPCGRRRLGCRLGVGTSRRRRGRRHRPRAPARDKPAVGCAQHAHHTARLWLVPSSRHPQQRRRHCRGESASPAGRRNFTLLDRALILFRRFTKRRNPSTLRAPWVPPFCRTA